MTEKNGYHRSTVTGANKQIDRLLTEIDELHEALKILKEENDILRCDLAMALEEILVLGEEE